MPYSLEEYHGWVVPKTRAAAQMIEGSSKMGVGIFDIVLHPISGYGLASKLEENGVLFSCRLSIRSEQESQLGHSVSGVWVWSPSFLGRRLDVKAGPISWFLPTMGELVIRLPDWDVHLIGK